jgi:hypothetical protein
MNQAQMTHPSVSQKWWIAKQLIVRHCLHLPTTTEEYELPEELSPAAHELFIEWLYTRTYQEEACMVTAFRTDTVKNKNLVLTIEQRTDHSIDWAVETGVLAWMMG